MSGGHLVDHAGPARAREILLDKNTGDRHGREALIPKNDRRRPERGEVAGESAGCLRTRTLGSIHVEGQTDHESCGLVRRHMFEQMCCVGLESGAPNRAKRRREAALDIGECEPDKLAAWVNADQSRPPGQAWGKRVEIEDFSNH